MSSPRSTTVRLALGATLAGGALLLAGCGSAGSSTPTATSSMGSTGSMGSMGSMDSMGSPSGTGGAHTGTATVTIKDFAFHGPASVAPGSSVTVRNDDSETHSLTADGAGGFDVTIGPGTTAMFTAPTKSGSYPYHCMFHGTMHGTLTVR